MMGEFPGQIGLLLLLGLALVILGTNFYLLSVWRQEKRRLTHLADTLSERNLLLKAMQEAMPEGFVAVNADGRVLAYNQRFIDMWGIPAEVIDSEHRAVVGAYLDSLVHDTQRIREQIEEAYADPTLVFRRQTHLKDGRIFEAHTAPLPDLHGQGAGRVWYYRDITALRNLEQQTRQREERLQAAVAVLADGFVLFDAEQRLVRCNQAFAELYQRQPEELVGMRRPDILRDGYRRGVGMDIGDLSLEQWLTDIERSQQRQPNRQFELRGYDGRWFVIAERLTESGELVSVRTDITRQKRQEAELRRLASTDSLTGALNHGQFIHQATKALSQARHYGHALTLVMLDADHFKQVNDHHGHAAGDTVLREIVQIMQQILRDSDRVGRLGGEEFAVLLPETDSTTAQHLAERLRACIAAQCFTGLAGDFNVTASIGIASLAAQDSHLDDLLKRADQALYQAKAQGRNRVCIADHASAPQNPQPLGIRAPQGG